MGPDATTAPLSSGPLLAGVLSVVGILCIAAVIIVVVLIVVIRGRRKATRTLDNGRSVILYMHNCVAPFDNQLNAETSVSVLEHIFFILGQA